MRKDDHSRNKNSQNESRATAMGQHSVVEKSASRRKPVIKSFETQMQESLAKERRYYEELVGIADDNKFGSSDPQKNLDEIRRKIKKDQSSLKTIKQNVKSKGLDQLKKEIQEQQIAINGVLNSGIDQWKVKYLYPFGNIAPIVDDNG